MAGTKILRSTDGQVVAFVALALVLLGLLVGLAVDSGRAYLLQARLSKLVDAVALAGAKAMQNATTLSEKIAQGEAAACNAAAVNGYACGASGATVSVTIGDMETPEGSVLGITVSASDTMTTSFMSLGALIGCSACSTVTVAATASAVPTTIPADVVLVMDDTLSMKDGCDPDQADADCPNFNAREGAVALVNALFPDGNPSEMRISMVPFRGCYDATNNRCVRFGEIIDLTDDRTALIGKRGSLGCLGECDNGTGIQGLWAQGNSGTNVCLAIDEGRNRLFGANSRPLARKIMIILTDIENSPSSGLPSPPPLDCNAGNDNTLDIQTNNRAAAVKGAPDNVEIFVLGYSVENPPNDPFAFCNPSGVGSSGSGNDRNLGKCITSSTAETNNHYFEAATPETIQTEFLAIADALKKVRLVR
jgi:Flp pilus assembly protein TadG